MNNNDNDIALQAQANRDINSLYKALIPIAKRVIYSITRKYNIYNYNEDQFLSDILSLVFQYNYINGRWSTITNFYSYIYSYGKLVIHGMNRGIWSSDRKNRLNTVPLENLTIEPSYTPTYIDAPTNKEYLNILLNDDPIVVWILYKNSYYSRAIKKIETIKGRKWIYDMAVPLFRTWCILNKTTKFKKKWRLKL